MITVSARVAHHAFSKYLDMAHEGQEVVVTKRGKPWATLKPIAATKQRKVVWPDIVKRASEASGGRTFNAVAAYLKIREEEPW
jgi:prevent-host-death family protein